MVSKIFSDEDGNKLELFVNNHNQFVITISDENEYNFICLDKRDLKELKKEIDFLLYNLKDDGI